MLKQIHVQGQGQQAGARERGALLMFLPVPLLLPAAPAPERGKRRICL
jgi:hypothetical protein